MTKAELNRDIKRLKNQIHQMESNNAEVFFKYINNEAKKEFTRLHYADTNFEYMNRTSILIMLGLNNKFRFISFHTFGIDIQLWKL